MRDSACGLIALLDGKIVAWVMADETPQPGEEKGSIHDRVQKLREEASQLSETFEGVEKSLREAAGESKELTACQPGFREQPAGQASAGG